MAARRLKIARTLHGRFLLALLLIGIIPLGLIGLGISFFQSKAISRQSATELVGLARGLAGQLDVQLSGLLEDARAISALPEIAGMDPARQNVLLQELFHHYHKFARLSVFDRTGRRVASSHQGGAPSIGTRTSFHAAIGRGQQSWEVAHALTTGRSSLLIHTPIRDAERQVVGVLGAVVDLEDISSAVSGLHVGGRGQAFVVDAAGRVLLHRDGAAVQQRLDYSWIGLPTGGRLAGPGTVKYSANGESIIAGYAPIPNTGWTVVVERPEAEIVLPAKRSLQLALAGLASSVALALLAAVLFALKLTRPVRQLTQAARALAAGDRSLPLESIAAKESDLGVLIDAFDVMRRAVETRERALKNSLERIRVLREIDAAVTSTLDLRTVLNASLEKVDLVMPYAAATIRLFNKATRVLEPVACRNLDEQEWKSEEWKGGRGVPNVVFETRAVQVIANVQTDPRVRDREFFRKHGLISYLGVPLIVKDEVLGVFSFYTREEHKFESEEVVFFSALAAQTAIAIHNSQLYEDMAKLAEDLTRSNKVKDEFLSVISHELRTPLSVIMGYTGMMSDGMLGAVSAEQKRALGKIAEQSKDLLAMINGILEATRIETEGLGVEENEIDLRLFLEQLESRYHLASGEELELIWNYPSNLPVVKTDREKMAGILRALIDNAIKFTAKGSVTISARCLSPRPDSCMIEFKVSDTGIGIAEESLPLIFEKFRQADSSETRSYGGVGLGLYLVKKYTELLRGKIEVDSEAGRGSTFTVTLPCEFVKEAGLACENPVYGSTAQGERGNR